MAEQTLRIPGSSLWISAHVLGAALTTITSPALAQEQTLTETVVTATRVETPIEHVGSSLSVITAEELDQRQDRVVSDVLRDLPGVAVNRTGVVGNQTRVSIRGAEPNQSLVVIDGVRVNNPDGTGFDFNSLLSSDIERIEVLRGPSSVLWGSDAIGGVVNIITKKAQRPLQASITIEGGSFDTGQISGSIGSRGERYDVLASGSYYETGGHSSGAESRGNSERDGARIGTVHLKAGVQPMDNLELTLVGSYNKDNSEFDAFFGGTVVPVVDADQEIDKTEYSLRAEGKLTLLGGAWEHIVSAGLYDIETDLMEDGTNTYASAGRTNEAYYQSNYYFGTPNFANSEHTITFLADYKEEESENDFFNKRTIRNNAVAMNYSVGFDDHLFFTAGIRHDDNDQFDSSTTYRLTGAYVQRDWGTRFHGSYGKAVKNPTMVELFGFSGDFQGNPNLQPETGLGWDLGVEQSFLDKRIKADATYFSSRIEDLITGAGRTVENLNGSSKAQGVEVSAQANLTDGLDLIASYTYTDTEDPEGNQLVRRPKNLASLVVNYSFPGDRANVNLAIRYNGDRQDFAYDPITFETSQVQLDSFTVVNLSGSYKVSDNLEIIGRIENLFDEEYEEALGYGNVGRGLYVGLKATL